MTRGGRLIDLSNLRSGGGLQVGISFLDEAAKLAESEYPWVKDVRIEVSTSVWEGISSETRLALPITIVDRRWNSVWAWFGRRRFATALIVFGPTYGRRRAHRQIVGFGDSTVTHGVPRGIRRSSLSRRARNWVRRHVSRALFRRADTLVVESSRTKAILQREFKMAEGDIEVIDNAYHGIFDEEVNNLDRIFPTDGFAGEDETLFAYVSRAYPHKNHDFCGRVGSELERLGWRKFKFVLTLTDEEWVNLSELTRKYSVNVGPLEVRELPAFYRTCHAGFFPSLLESFSVTPLEVMRMGLPLFASDRDFVRDFCGNVPFYFDPLNAADAAAVIAEAWLSEDSIASRSREGIEFSKSLPTSRDRAIRYLELLDGR